MVEYKEKQIVFDLDDTLYKERDYELSGFRCVACEIARRFNIPEAGLTDIMLADEASHPFDRLYNYLDKAVSIEEMLLIYRNHFPSIILPCDTVNCLSELKREGVRLGIITDGRHIGQWNKINALGLTEYIDSSNIIVSEDVGSDKTTLIPWQRMCEQSVDVGERWYVGDNIIKDFVIPNKLGWITVMLVDNGRNVHRQNVEVSREYMPSYTIESLALLPELVFGR